MTDKIDKTINMPDDEPENADTTSDETEDDEVAIDWLGDDEEDE